MRFALCFRRSAFPIGLLAIPIGIGWAQINACDLTASGAVDAADVQAAINMSLGITPCTANIAGPGVCNVGVVQRVINAALGGACVAGVGAVGHYVSLSWTASSSTNVVGYNVYRGTATGGPYTEVSSSLIVGATYTDGAISPGTTYFYVATAKDNNGAESGHSNEVQAVIPSP